CARRTYYYGSSFGSYFDYW
nr:immunoglobulin heavy chain junction region [Mus musculus]